MIISSSTFNILKTLKGTESNLTKLTFRRADEKMGINSKCVCACVIRKKLKITVSHVIIYYIRKNISLLKTSIVV